MKVTSSIKIIDKDEITQASQVISTTDSFSEFIDHITQFTDDFKLFFPYLNVDYTIKNFRKNEIQMGFNISFENFYKKIKS